MASSVIKYRRVCESAADTFVVIRAAMNSNSASLVAVLTRSSPGMTMVTSPYNVIYYALYRLQLVPLALRYVLVYSLGRVWFYRGAERILSMPLYSPTVVYVTDYNTLSVVFNLFDGRKASNPV